MDWKCSVADLLNRVPLCKPLWFHWSQSVAATEKKTSSFVGACWQQGDFYSKHQVTAHSNVFKDPNAVLLFLHEDAVSWVSLGLHLAERFFDFEWTLQ